MAKEMHVSIRMDITTSAPSQPYVLAFVGENENGILRWRTEMILKAFASRGLAYKLIDLRSKESVAELKNILAAGKPEFCFSFQGMGMGVTLDSGENLWTRMGVPFLSCMGDNPYHAPSLHSVEGPGMYLLYACKDFLETYKEFMHGRTFACTFHTGYPEKPLADQKPWSQRHHDIVFVKTAVDPKQLSAEWATYPKKIRDIMYDCSARILSGADETVAVQCAQVFADRQIHWGDRRELFLSTCSLVDRYVRAVRAERMVLALMQHNALIVGDWSYLDRSKSRAAFRNPIPADDLDALYADSRIVVNTLPAVRFGVHERIIAGLLSKTAVVSETTPHLQQMLRDCPSYLGVEIDREEFSDQLDQTLNSCLANPDTAEQVQTSAAVALELFSFEAFIQMLLEHIDLGNHYQKIKWWAFPPSANRAQEAH
jgi:hypothetical protein